MSYLVRLFYNTGFNSINVPDSPTLLQSFTYRDFPAIDLLQVRELDSITLRATYEDVKNADYACVQNQSVLTDVTYFAVDGGGIRMSSPDVAVIPLTIDYLTTAGGVSSLEILDGITERHHVATADDTFGAYAEEDPYLVASKPLEIVDAGTFPANSLGGEFVIVESTSSLTQMGFTKDEPIAKKCVQYDTGLEVASVTIPDTAPLTKDDYTTYAMMTKPYGQSTVAMKEVKAAGSALYILQNPTNGHTTDGVAAADGISALRAIGCESAILNCYVIPRDYLYQGSSSGTGGPVVVTDTVTKADGTTGSVQYEHISKIIGVGTENTLAGLVPFVYDNTVKNKRVLYGELNKYGICATGTGNLALFRPEEIYHTGDAQPTLEYYADPRPSGCPYFRFKYLNGNDKNVFMNCITGAVWQRAPLVFTDKSGSMLDEIKLNASQAISRAGFNMGMLSQTSGDMLNTGAGMIRSGFGKGGTTPTGFGGDILARGMAGAASLIEGASEAQSNYIYTALSPYARRKFDFENELAMQNLNLGLSQVVAPTVSFPRADGIRDYVGNSCYVFRYRPQATDLAKMDKILTMYGYKDTTPFISAHLTNRAKFNFIKASGVSVKTSMPKWINDGISMMFLGGLRIWHVAPNNTCYTDGTNV